MILYPLQHQGDEVVNGILVVGIGFLGQAVGYDHADGGGLVSEEQGETC